LVLALAVAGVAAVVGAARAGAAAAASALQRCQSGAAPDVTQSVYEAGTQVQATYPNDNIDPDNALYPGDVVRVTVTGSVRYDATHWTDANGVGSADASGLRPYSSTATFNNNPGGWVGAEHETLSLGACTRTPNIGTRIIYRLHDAKLADNAGGFTITTRVWRAPGRVVLDGTEATQGIQTAYGQVPLIASKRTYLRVYLHYVDDGAPMTGVTGTVQLNGVTVRPVSTATLATAPTDRRSLAGSLLFQLPQAGIARGTRAALLTVTPARGAAITKHIWLTFGRSTSLKVIGLRYSYDNVPEALTQQLKGSQPGLNVPKGRWQARPTSAWEPLRRLAQDALPLTSLTITDKSTSNWGSKSFDCKAVHDPTSDQWSCDGYKDAKTWETSYADLLCPDGGCYVMLLQPEIDSGEDGTSWTSPAGNHVMNMQGEADPHSQGDTLAHELGHALGLRHAGHLSDADPNYPRSDGGLGPFVALRYVPTLELVPGTDAAGHTAAYDLMSYQRPAWFSPYNYCKALAGLPGNHPVCPPGLVG
jgi:hypothetical protein